MRLLVCGGTGYSDRAKMFDILDYASARSDAYGDPISLLIHGDAEGADRLAGSWADERGVPVEAYPARWSKYGRSAGPIRNREMIARGRPDLVIAFPGNRGTADMKSAARAAGVIVVEIR